MSREWNASVYDRVSGPQVAMAGPVLDRLELRGDETVLDAGCGSGRVTEMLLERLPEGRVIAVDASPTMIEHARAALAGRATVLQADLLELELDETVDAVFSNAVFHWVPDHDRLFDRLHAALRPGGRLVAQCGGEGNVARLHRAANEVARDGRFAGYFEEWVRPWNFAGPEETTERLGRAGFDEVQAWLEPYPVTPDDPATYLRTVCLGPHLELLPDGLREEFVAAVRERMGDELDYVRLNIMAVRTSPPSRAAWRG
jgi:trans-aconitate 2-methyltransferase